MSAQDLLDGLNLAGRYVLLAAIYYAVVAYPLLKIVARRRRRAADAGVA